MANTLVLDSGATRSSSEVRFVTSPSQPRRGAQMHPASGTPNDTTYVQTLSGKLLEGWALREPISVVVEPDDDGYIASDSITTVYGYGATGPDALLDYIISLCEFHQLLEAANTLESYQRLERLGRYLIKTQD